MQDIINKYAPVQPACNRQPHWATNPEYAYGLHLMLHTRIFIFGNSNAKLSIDFTVQQVIANAIIIVPPLHLYTLTKTAHDKFVCIDLHNSLLTDRVWKRLLYLNYQSQKVLAPNGPPADDCTYNSIAALSNLYDTGNHYISQLNKWMAHRLPENQLVKAGRSNHRHYDIAMAFIRLLARRKLTVQSCQVTTLAPELFCTERTLHRVCKHIFGLSAGAVTQYHFALKAIYLLRYTNLSYPQIAAELQFSSTASFNHFIKNRFDLTPSQIRHAATTP